MSESAAPAAPAAPSQSTTPAPVEGEKTATPVDPLAELDERISKAGLKYKAAGKERTVSSIKELLRKAEMADGLQAKQAELMERQKRIEAVEERDARLKAAKTGKERAAILREYAGGEAFDEAAEEAILERIEREKAMSGLSPTERAAKEEAERYRAQLAQYEAEKAQAEEERRRQAEAAEYESTRNEAATIAVKALTAAGLPKEAAPDAVRRIGMLAQRAVAMGLNVDPADLATEAVKMAADDFRAYTSKAEGDALLNFIGEQAAQRISRAWLAKVEGRSAVKATLPAPTVTEKPQTEKVTRNPMAAWADLARGR